MTGLAFPRGAGSFLFAPDSGPATFVEKRQHVTRLEHFCWPDLARAFGRAFFPQDSCDMDRMHRFRDGDFLNRDFVYPCHVLCSQR